MLMTTVVLVGAGILVYALRQKRDVKFMVKLWGANVLLEAKDAGGGLLAPENETRDSVNALTSKKN
jgi:hypothetical protein